MFFNSSKVFAEAFAANMSVCNAVLHPKKRNYATKAIQNLSFKLTVILEIRIPAAFWHQ